MSARPHQRPQGKPAPVRSLRIGVILGGKIIEEKLFRKNDPITVGQSSKNTFAVPVEGLPRQWTLFHPETSGGYLLNFSERMDGRVSDGQGIYTFDQLRAGPAQKRGDHWVLPLAPSARGKITFGELTILFQFVKAPPVQPRPKLPVSVRGTFADRIDPLLAGIMAVSILLHGGFSWWLYDRDVKRKTKLELISENMDAEPERSADLFTIPVQPDEPAVVVDEGTGAEQEGGGEEDKKPDKKPAGDGSKKKGEGSGGPPSDAAIREAVENSAVINVLTGGSGGGSRYSEMSGKDPGGDLDKSLKNIGGSGTKISSRGEGGLGSGTRGPASGEIGTGSGTGVGGPGDTGRVGGDKGETQISSRTSVGSVEDFGESATLDPATVASTIRRRYLKGVQRCHEKLLKTDPKAGGRVEIEITIGKIGKVVSANISGFDSGVDACIKGLALQWRFPIPKDDDGKPTEATYIMPFILKASG